MTPRFSNHRDGSGSLAFPAPSSTFRRCRPGPRGVPFLAAAPTEAGADDPHDLGLPFEALARALVPPRGRSSSREIRAPLHRHHLRASTPGSKLPSARLCDLSSSFRPRGFAPPRRLAPHTGSRVCCTPQPVRGSPRFRDVGAGPVRRRWRTSEPLPRGAGSHPSKSVLVDSRSRITAVRCPLAVAGAHPTTPRGRSRTTRGRSRRTGSRGASEPAGAGAETR
jgi:hypothetical protein